MRIYICKLCYQDTEIQVEQGDNIKICTTERCVESDHEQRQKQKPQQEHCPCCGKQLNKTEKTTKPKRCFPCIKGNCDYCN